MNTDDSHTEHGSLVPRLSTNTIQLLLLLSLASLLLLIGLGDMGLTDRDEGSNAEAAREMLETGDWISPTLNYEPRYAKPAFVYWVISSIYALFGINEFTARLPSALFGMALLILQYGFVNRMLGSTVALFSSLMLLLNAEFVGIHRMVLTDPELVFFTTLATYSFWLGFAGEEKDPRWMWGFYIGMGLAMLAKGPVGILIPLLAVIPYLTLTRRWRAFFAEGKPLTGWLLFLLIAAPWYVAMFSIHGSEYAAAAQANTTGRFANPMEGHGGIWLFFIFIPVVLVGFFPWSGLLPVAVYQQLKPWKEYRSGARSGKGEDGLLLFCSLWIMAILLFFTISATKLPHYILPLFPAASLMAAVLWSRFLIEPEPRGLGLSLGILVLVGYLLGIGLVALPGIFETFKDKIAVEFPAAGQLAIGPTPVIAGVMLFVGVIAIRMTAMNEHRRPIAFWIAGGLIAGLLVMIILFPLPHFSKYFLTPPQELAKIAGLNLGEEDHLIQFGRKRPSLSFYAQRKVHFLGPNENKKLLELVESGKLTMLILQEHLLSRLPTEVAQFPVLLRHHGFVLLSSQSFVAPADSNSP